jgi:hypothetical protein
LEKKFPGGGGDAGAAPPPRHNKGPRFDMKRGPLFIDKSEP